jgi:hypothetical protein
MPSIWNENHLRRILREYETTISTGLTGRWTTLRR